MQKNTRVCLFAFLWLVACENGGQPSAPSATGSTSDPAMGGSQPAGNGSQPASNGSQPAGNGGQAGPGASGGTSGQAPAVLGPYATSQASAVLWKRHGAFETDLMRALELSRDELCKELGERNCIRDIHVIALGGNDPFRSGINVPPSAPLSTTSIVVDRVLLSACSARARADKAKSAKVFTALDLKGPAPAPEAPAVEATIVALFHRLLARDPRVNETAVVKRLLERDGPDAIQSAEEFATLACFVIGSSVEFFFQ
jgi:hypothetical protein